MCEFKHGDEIEYEISGQWRKGTYVAPHPISVNCHVYIAQQGHTDERPVERIRKPKQKREGWVNVYNSGVCGSIYATEEGARASSGINCIAIARIEWEE